MLSWYLPFDIALSKKIHQITISIVSTCLCSGLIETEIKTVYVYRKHLGVQKTIEFKASIDIFGYRKSLYINTKKELFLTFSYTPHGKS